MSGNHTQSSAGLFHGVPAAFRDAAIATAAFSALGLAVNLVHPEAIPYIAEAAYEILVPCPEPGGDVGGIDASDRALREDSTFVVDARPEADFQKWRFRGAANVTYDYLDPTPPQVLQKLARDIARSGARRVVVYGDGDTPDTGEQLAKEISGHGIKNVSYLKGGVPGLRSLTKPESGKGGAP